jgi:choline oxidase
METREFDCVIVGGGGAGAVLARTLADSTNYRIALLEQGPSDENRPEVLDFRRNKEVVEGPLSRRIPIVAPKKGNKRVSYPISRVLGGCTSHNTCIWFRPPASDFEDWVEAGAAGWGPEPIRTCFDALEARVRVETETPESDSHSVLLRAAETLGYPRIDFGKPFGEGIGHYRLSKIGTQRQSSSVVYLHPTTALPKTLALFTETEAIKVLFGPSGEAVGVSTNRGDFHARREVVLCAGAIDTPRLLMHSGIGPADQLRQFGIAVRRDLPGVGAHLLDHPACGVNVSAERPLEKREPWNYSGVLFAYVDASEPWPDIEIQLGPELFEQQTLPAGYPSAPEGFNAYITVNRARSEGSVRLASPDPRVDLAVEPAYFSDPDDYDLKMMLGGVVISRRLFATPIMKGWAGRELAPGVDCRNDRDMLDYVRHTVTTGYHPAGTCRMGDARDRRSVVDPDLKVIGIRNLRVADASIFPRMVSVNIAPTCMMIGHRAAELIGGGNARRPRVFGST